MRKNQRGFGAVELLIILVVVGIVGFGAWYVGKHGNKSATNITSSSTNSSKTTTPATKTYTDNSKTYTLEYPKTWTTSEQKPGSAAAVADLLNLLETEFTPENSPAIGSNPSTPNMAGVIAFKSSDTQTILNTYVSGDGQTTPQSLTINGYRAMYQKAIATKYLSYTDDIYAVTHNGVTLLFQFREKQGSGANGTPAFDATNTVDAYTTLVKSVKFLN